MAVARRAGYQPEGMLRRYGISLDLLMPVRLAAVAQPSPATTVVRHVRRKAE